MDHALCGCEHAMKICNNIFTHVDNKIMVVNNFADRITCLATYLQDEEFEKACIALWTIWNDRNSFYKNMPATNGTHCCEWIN